MSKARLGDAKRRALEAYSDFLTDTRREYVAVTLGINHRTIDSLRNAGLIELYEAAPGDWRYRITDAGRKALQETTA